MNVIFDLDGTLADCEHRRHHVSGSVKNWKAFFAECGNDTVIEHIAELFRFYRDVKGYNVFILSGRMGGSGINIKTMNWVHDNDLMPSPRESGDDWNFHIRKNGDYRSDVEIKHEMITNLRLTPENTIAVFDDRNCMVNAWRLWGFNCLQVAPGDF